MYNLDDDQLRQLFGFQMPEDQNFKVQNPPSIQQGLLGDTDTQDQILRNLVGKGASETAANMAQSQRANQGGTDGNALLAQRQAQGSQIAMQQAAQQQKQQEQQGQIIGTLLKMWLMGGA